ncbi:MAG: beta-eliminating lyase-related protein [Planctomycetaceae bacterium]|nr:beta-eliminating lyase-related protein [Planctomycetaceae bacterium]
MIDLRSDTVTRPVAAMKQAMMDAEVGDDVMGEDPTVRHLESMVADLLGKEGAVFACSGTQSNQMGLRAHCVPGDELLINATGHIGIFECGGPAALSGITVRQIEAPKGMLSVADLEDKPRVDDQHYCRTRLVCLENTTNIAGGFVYSLGQLQDVSGWAWSQGLKMHLDGARFFNATVAGGYTPAELAACFDTISICFSKGLGCPMGSILAGSQEEVRLARRARKMFGGAMRQSGMMAAAAVYALENHVDRMQQDHDNAQRLATLLAQIDGVAADPAATESNLVFFEIDPELGTAVQLSAALRERGVLIGPMGGQKLRAATHLDVAESDISVVAEAVADCVTSGFAEQALVGSGPYSK